MAPHCVTNESSSEQPGFFLLCLVLPEAGLNNQVDSESPY